MTKKEHNDQHDNKVHISSYGDHVGTWLGLIILTIMTVTISVYGADLQTMTVLTAMLIASTKALIVAFYFMHLKYDPKIYKIMIAIVLVLFVVFATLTLVDYMDRV